MYMDVKYILSWCWSARSWMCCILYLCAFARHRGREAVPQKSQGGGNTQIADVGCVLLGFTASEAGREESGSGCKT